MRALRNIYDQLIAFVPDDNVIPFVRPDPPRLVHEKPVGGSPPVVTGRQQSEVRA